MADFTVRSDHIDVEQIMRQIRARIRDKRGADYTEQEIRELASVKLDKFLDPRAVRSDLLQHYRRERQPAPLITAEEAHPPLYDFNHETVYISDRGAAGRILTIIRKILKPFTKLFFHVDTLWDVLSKQSRLNAQHTALFQRIHQRLVTRDELDALNFEMFNNLVVELTRLGIEVKNLRMQVESFGTRLDFDERRARALEGVVQYRPGAPVARPPQAPAGAGPGAGPGTGTGIGAGVAPGAREDASDDDETTEGGETRSARRRRRRRGRRRGPGEGPDQDQPRQDQASQDQLRRGQPGEGQAGAPSRVAAWSGQAPSTPQARESSGTESDPGGNDPVRAREEAFWNAAAPATPAEPAAEPSWKLPSQDAASEETARSESALAETPLADDEASARHEAPAHQDTQADHEAQAVHEAQADNEAQTDREAQPDPDVPEPPAEASDRPTFTRIFDGPRPTKPGDPESSAS